MELPKVIGLCGYATSGKDESARVLVEQFGYTRLALADPLKEMARALGWNGTKEEIPPCDHCGMLQGRALLQRFGTEAVRENLGEDTWINNAVRIMEQDTTKRYVIPDIRFPNEAALLRKYGDSVNMCEIYKIERPGFGIGLSHASEAQIDSIIVDDVIINDGTVEDLEKTVQNLMNSILDLV